ncbi:hypothetical protein ZHAS_00007828 [Anopheles sinensis]|uniref:Uncharacterized protein n=1 Tax=Anopheles sinensis TaxID=74873 RepID=A0A084VQM4_ANOSI|nr:hypothetical protein ZHAS_00007828 [Anopheles sinensis]
MVVHLFRRTTRVNSMRLYDEQIVSLSIADWCEIVEERRLLRRALFARAPLVISVRWEVSFPFALGPEPNGTDECRSITVGSRNANQARIHRGAITRKANWSGHHATSTLAVVIVQWATGSPQLGPLVVNLQTITGAANTARTRWRTRKN